MHSVQPHLNQALLRLNLLIQALFGRVRVVVQNAPMVGGVVVGLKKRHLISQVIRYTEWIAGVEQ